MPPDKDTPNTKRGGEGDTSLKGNIEDLDTGTLPKGEIEDTGISKGENAKTDYQGGYSPKLPTADNKPTTSPLKIEANPEFGENFAAFAGKGAEAVKKLLQEQRGQVAGAFYARVDKSLITGIPDVRKSYISKEIKDADIIHSFIPH